MCGIGGVLGFGNSSISEIELDKMLSTQKHRGPDNHGIFKDLENHIGIIHNRLSIIDLEGGVQPMESNDDMSIIAFNGEIYGYKKIKSTLTNYNFKNTSDTEVILALYSKYGENFINFLPGMFAISLWDKRTKTLYLARDRFGEKPLYYFTDDDKIVYSSEIKGIRAYLKNKLSVDYEQLGYYLRKGYVHPEKSIYHGVRQVPPGHILKITAKGKMALSPFWKLPEKNNNILYDEACIEFHRIFSQAVEKQMIADVPVSAFLSGGMDSSAVVIEAAKLQPNIQTLSFRFEGEADETPFADMIAKKFNVKNEIINLNLGNSEPDEIFRNLVHIYDQPFADTSSLPTFLICKKAAEFSKVALTGDGGDELLAGYPWYRTIQKMEGSSKIPYNKLFLKKIQNKINSLIFSSGFTLNEELIIQDLKHRFPSFNNYYDAFHNGFSQNQLNGLLKSNANISNSKYTWGADWIDHQTQADYAEYLPGQILVKTDRAAMANSLELRAPFLDVELVDFVLSLPSSFKIDGHSDKKILRQTYSAIIPTEILNRKKQGFGMPLDQVFKSQNFKDLKAYYLQDEKRKVFDLIDFQFTQKFLQKDNQQLYTLLMLSIWAEELN